ncbi:MAG TPA: tRNA (N6-isopentenyl adenosine(37)-C2)-methylthiotransferase MiaB [Oligoflexia bacterium]|nr:tRNA (N6-isopentenyl adenosine(37)-C2)-methylthiotransferase MiaB [Oligoflexia bacterium]HMP27661.1 tRNA (N6-isopentenyl adenosine(37)-C2)-methylthiotransferase MiaB [Oligoflexia bacterium]
MNDSPIQARKVYIKTFGCQMNEYDSQKILKILEPNFLTTKSAEEADLVLINTCSVREKPEQKLYNALGELRELKKNKPQLLVGVGGCVAQQEGERIVKSSPLVDFVFGTHNLSLVPSLIERRSEGLPPQVAVNYRDEWEELPAGFVESDRVSVFIAISRGCNKNCTYCIVPTTRGREVSRPYEEIEREVKIALQRGAKEVVLLGQTVNSYGLDLTPRVKFAQLVERLSQLDGLKRIRFTSPHPAEVRDDFIELAASNPKVCRHIHMPLQSGSNAILKAMNRNYRKERYLQIIEKLKTRVPDMAITTDIIVGFPGETEKDLEETLSVMQIVGFESSFSFMFSPRPGTPAEFLPNQIPQNEKLDRLYRLQKLQDKLTSQKLESYVGNCHEVLIDGHSKSESDKLCGRTSQNTLVNFEKSYPNLKKGDLVMVKINSKAKHTLRGELSI